MSVYRVIILGAARKQIKRISRDEKKRILDKIEKLGSNPRPHGYKELKGETILFRVRVGDYRIIYDIQDQVLIVTVLKIGNRREVYR